MKGFLISKRKTFELLLLLGMDLVFYFLWSNWDFVILFSLGYIWNWVTSQEKELNFENKRYRFSTIKSVLNLHNLILKPFKNLPEAIKFIVRCIPAGLFWSAVIIFNGSFMPWWAVFIGSLTLELVELEKKFYLPKETNL